MGWFTDGGPDEDGNSRQPVWNTGSSGSNDSSSSSGCVVVLIALGGGLATLGGWAAAGAYLLAQVIERFVV